MEMISDPRFSDIRFPQIPRYRFSEMSFETLSFQKPVLMIQIIALNTVSDFFGNRFQFSRMVFQSSVSASRKNFLEKKVFHKYQFYKEFRILM